MDIVIEHHQRKKACKGREVQASLSAGCSHTAETMGAQQICKLVHKPGGICKVGLEILSTASISAAYSKAACAFSDAQQCSPGRTDHAWKSHVLQKHDTVSCITGVQQCIMTLRCSSLATQNKQPKASN